MGTFITFEGIEGCGKTTQINLLKAYLLKKNYTVQITREPGGTRIGDQIRKILLSDKNHAISDKTELLLYEACRAQHIKEVILPALKEDKIVLCDRFADSTLAYQGYGRKIDLGFIQRLDHIVAGELRPDLTILLDMDVDSGLQRAKNRNSKVTESEREERFEKETLEFHERIRKGFLELAEKDRKRIRIIDGSKSVDEIQKIIRDLIEEIL
jgi:dTMP kinase